MNSESPFHPFPHDTGLDNDFVDMTPKHSRKAKIVGLLQTKKASAQQRKQQSKKGGHGMGEIFANNTSDKGRRDT